MNVKKYGRVKGIIICKLSILVFLRFCIRPRGNDNEFILQATNNRNYIYIYNVTSTWIDECKIRKESQ